jgi:hypothetical protein
VHNRTLHDAVHAFAEQAAWQLAAEVAEGAEVPFELVEARGRGRASLYAYRPLSEQFIRARLGVLGRLPTWGPAANALEGQGGLDAYLRLRGEPRVPEDRGEQADAVLRSFLGALFEESSDFVLEAERFARAYEQLELSLFETRARAQVAAPLRGLALVSPEVPLGGDLALVRADALTEPPGELARLGRGGEERAGEALVVLTVEAEPGAPPPLTAARGRFRRLLTALRLFEPKPFVIGPTAWSRIDRGAWQLQTLGLGGRPAGDAAILEPEAEDELRAFCNLVARRSPRSGELAWALGRFEMGCERLAPFEALTDYLLALRAVLEPEGPGSGMLARRLAAICALPEQRGALAERVAHAISLERAVIAGLAPAEPGVDALVEEVADHLRALLRDAVCGHLDSDLVRVADEIAERERSAPAAPEAPPGAPTEPTAEALA